MRAFIVDHQCVVENFPHGRLEARRLEREEVDSLAGLDRMHIDSPIDDEALREKLAGSVEA